MPSLDNRSAVPNPIKMLVVGNSGAGKTSAIAQLANVGYRLFWLDFDNGLDILPHLVKPQFQNRVFYKTCIDPLISIAGKIKPKGAPVAYTSAIAQMQDWKEDGKSLGSVTSWGPDDVLIVDSLTFLGKAIMYFVLAANNRLDSAPWQSDWGQAMELQEKFIGLLYSSDVKCNVIVTAHLTSTREGVDDKGQPLMSDKLFPTALGNKLPPKIGRFFNAMLLAKTLGSKRYLSTISSDQVDVKTALPPGTLPALLDIDTALPKYFEVLSGRAKVPVAA